MAHAINILHEMAGWEESADRPVMAPPVLRPGDVFPPRPPEADRRRGPGWPVWVAIVVVLALGGGLVGYVTARKSTATPADQVAAVRKAYLAWWGARKQAYYRLDPTPMKPLMTQGGYRQESALLAQEQRADEPTDIDVPKHNTQIVIYKGSNLASVDDIWKSENVILDPTTHAPTSKPLGDYVEDSTTMKLVSGKWLVADRGTFGASSQVVPGTSISYAAAPEGHPEAAVKAALQSAFNSYNSVVEQAYGKLDPSQLATVEIQPQLGIDLSHMQRQRSKREPVRYVGQDNYRIGIMDSTHAWIYDTIFDESVALNEETGKPVEPIEPRVYRIRYSLIKEAQGWMVEDSGLD